MPKYEIYLPLKYNDGTGIEPEKLEEIQHQLLAVFSAMTVSHCLLHFTAHGATEVLSSLMTLFGLKLLPKQI